MEERSDSVSLPKGCFPVSPGYLTLGQNLGSRKAVNGRMSCARVFQMPYLTAPSWQFHKEMGKTFFSMMAESLSLPVCSTALLFLHPEVEADTPALESGQGLCLTCRQWNTSEVTERDFQGDAASVPLTGYTQPWRAEPPWKKCKGTQLLTGARGKKKSERGPVEGSRIQGQFTPDHVHPEQVPAQPGKPQHE